MLGNGGIVNRGGRIRFIRDEWDRWSARGLTGGAMDLLSSGLRSWDRESRWTLGSYSLCRGRCFMSFHFQSRRHILKEPFAREGTRLRLVGPVSRPSCLAIRPHEVRDQIRVSGKASVCHFQIFVGFRPVLESTKMSRLYETVLSELHLECEPNATNHSAQLQAMDTGSKPYSCHSRDRVLC